MTVPRWCRGTQRRPGNRLLSTACVAAVAALAAGCGSGDGGAAAGGDGPIKIGAVLSKTGAQSQYGLQAIDGIQMALKYVNDKGGVKGRQLSVDIRDDAGERVQAIDQMRKLAGDDSFVAIIGPQSTLAYKPTTPIAGQEHVVDFSAGAFGDVEWNPWTFRAVTTTAVAIPKYVQAYHQMKPFGSAAFAYDSTNDNNTLEVDLAKKAMQSEGVQVTGTQVFQAGNRDFSSAITSILRNPPDVIWLSAQTNEAAAFITQVRRRGFQGTILGGSGLQDPGVVKLTHGGSAGTVTYTGFDPTSTGNPVAKRFVKAYEARKDGTPPVYSALGYDAILVLAEALKRSNEISREGIKDALTNLCDFEIATGEVCYHGSGDSSTQPVYIGIWQRDGSLDVIKSLAGSA